MAGASAGDVPAGWVVETVTTLPVHLKEDDSWQERRAALACDRIALPVAGGDLGDDRVRVERGKKVDHRKARRAARRQSDVDGSGVPERAADELRSGNVCPPKDPPDSA